MQVEQAILGKLGAALDVRARSPGFAEEWLPWAERLCAGFGEPPPGQACPPTVFAQPFGPRHVAVVQVVGQPGALTFHFLVLPRRLYADIGGDPFFIAEQCPPPWEARGNLPTIEWTAGPAPYRTVGALQRVMDVPYLATLLGGTQVLVDGGRLVFERTEPALSLLRSLWALLPTNTRVGLWPTTFAFSNALRFHVVVMPRAAWPELEHYVTEDQAGDHPEGRYELALQTAVEDGDQADVDALFARRTPAQMWRLGLVLLIVLMLFAMLMQFNPHAPPAEKGAEKKAPVEKPAAKGEVEKKGQGGPRRE
jgi:hypothetical protein